MRDPASLSAIARELQGPGIHSLCRRVGYDLGRQIPASIGVTWWRAPRQAGLPDRETDSTDTVTETELRDREIR
jgi:hypothetical protein